MLLRWRKRVWRCQEPVCPVRTFTENHPVAAPRARLTRLAVVWAADALAEDDTTVSALARRLHVDWHTLWDALQREAQRRAADPARLSAVESLGVDEHVWRPGRFGAGREVTCLVDLSRDVNGQVRSTSARPGAGPLRAGLRRLAHRPDPQFRARVKHAALDPFRGYANALRDALSDAVQVLDAFHVVKLGTQVLDEVRRRVQQEQLGRRGHGRPAVQDPRAAAARRRAPDRPAARSAHRRAARSTRASTSRGGTHRCRGHALRRVLRAASSSRARLNGDASCPAPRRASSRTARSSRLTAAIAEPVSCGEASFTASARAC